MKKVETPLKIAHVIIDVTSDEKYSKYKQRYEFILALFRIIPFLAESL